MKNILFSLILAIFFPLGMMSQSVTVGFTGKDAANHYVQLDRVIISNVTKGWQETIYWPDLSIILNGENGINEYVNNEGFALLQNNPNPFNGTTDVNMVVFDTGEVTLVITDLNGRVIEIQKFASLSAGHHLIRITLFTAGTYIVTAHQNGKTTSIKMVNNGAGNENRIDYVGIIKIEQGVTFQRKSQTIYPFDFGDLMDYVGYATINEAECESMHISQVQEISQSIIFQFAETQTLQDGFPCPYTPTVTDIDGNVYNTVQIGLQCWMKENLRTTRYTDSTEIPLGGTFSGPLRYVPANNPNNIQSYGYLYNWLAVMQGAEPSSSNPSAVQGVCPLGWHVPSCAEWRQLNSYVSGQSQYWCGWESENIAKALASTEGWAASSRSCSVGNQQSANNATGFSALPAGLFFYTSNYYGYTVYEELSYSTTFWSSDEYINNERYCCTLSYEGSGGVSFHNESMAQGYSVRCVRDDGNSIPSIPTVTTEIASNITETSAISGGNVTSDGGAPITSRGVCWSTSHYPTIHNSINTSDGTSTGGFNSNLTNLTIGTTYYMRAYATNSVGTAYGNEVIFTTLPVIPQEGQPCPGIPTITDIDGNIYNTIQIGQQCWMKENLRTTRYADNRIIPVGINTPSETDPFRYPPANNEGNVSTLGYLYNWAAVMYGAPSSTSNPSGVQGICPTGWHVPSDVEWIQLTEYVSSQSEYQCGYVSTNIAKSVASREGWPTCNSSCTVGHAPNANNATGFTAYPAGRCCLGWPHYFQNDAFFWSATAGYVINIRYDYGGVNTGYYYDKSNGYSVRCVKD